MAWLRVLLACALFSALQAVLGAWVVSAVAGAEVTEICTPTGMQWVPVADAQAAVGRDPQDPWPQGLAKPCVWAAAFAAAPPPPPSMGGVAWVPGAGVQPVPAPSVITPDTVARVLLMAPMRAPPA